MTLALLFQHTGIFSHTLAGTRDPCLSASFTAGQDKSVTRRRALSVAFTHCADSARPVKEWSGRGCFGSCNRRTGRETQFEASWQASEELASLLCRECRGQNLRPLQGLLLGKACNGLRCCESVIPFPFTAKCAAQYEHLKTKYFIAKAAFQYPYLGKNNAKFWICFGYHL